MKKCPKCGKMNFSNVSICSDCKENLESVRVPIDNQPSQQRGMHWFWAWLIMQGISYATDTILVNIYQGIDPIELLGNFSTYICILMLCKLLTTYLAIFIWIRLTFRRYFYAGPWSFFTYLWNITTPFLLLMQFNTVLLKVNMHSIALWVITLLGILVGVIGFTIYKKVLEKQL